MARTKERPRIILPMDPKDWKHIQKTPAFPFKRGSEPMIRKYYPKSSKIFWKGLLHKYQTPDADDIPNPNTSILLKYKRDFFNSFSANWNVEGPKPGKLPHNVKHLSLHDGDQFLLKKIIKQNKRVKHIEFAVWNYRLCSELVEALKYCRNLCSITFHCFPFISVKTLNSMRRSFGHTLQKVAILKRIDGAYPRKPEEFARVMETIFEFPKLKEIKFEALTEMATEYFPVKKLQELQDKYTACNLKLKLPRGTSEAFLESIPGVKPDDYVRITMRFVWKIYEFPWDKGAVEKRRIQSLCRQVRDIDVSAFEDFQLPTLLNRFRETSNLELVLSRDASKADYSGIKELSNLKHLNIDIEDSERGPFLSDLFENLSSAVEAHKKLEELIMRVSFFGFPGDNDETFIISFFHHCAETLKKAHFELLYSGENVKELETFYEGIGKLKNLQSLTILLDLRFFRFDEKIEELSDIMSRMKSLKEVDLEIKKHQDSLEEVDLEIKKPQYGETPIHPFLAAHPIERES